MAMKYCDKHKIWYDYNDTCPECTKFGRIAGNIIGGTIYAGVWAGKKVYDKVKAQNEKNKQQQQQQSQQIDATVGVYEEIAQKQYSSLDERLIDMLSRGSIRALYGNTNLQLATTLYKETTGKILKDSALYVARLEFFRTHQFADESAWETYLKDKQKLEHQTKRVVWILVLIIIPLALFVSWLLISAIQAIFW